MEPSPSPSPDVDVSYSTTSKSDTSTSGAAISGQIPVFSSSSSEVADGMNTATNSLWNAGVTRCNGSDTLTACSVTSQVIENSGYISVLLTGTYSYGEDPSQTVYDGVILDKNTGKTVTAATVLSKSESEIQSQIGGSYQAAVVQDGAVKFYKTDGTTASISLP